MQIVSNIALISINETLIVQLVSFLIFVFIINRLMFRPIQELMRQRESHIVGVKNEIEKAIKDLDLAKRQMEEEETAVRKEAFVIKKELEESGGREAGRIFEAARNEINAQRAKAEDNINFQIQESRKQIKKESEALATAMIEKMLDRTLA